MRKPKGMTLVQLPAMQPDCCFDCPLCGLVPKDYGRPKNSKETHVCCGTMEALTGRGIKVKASAKDKNHPLRRPCDGFWDAWLQAPERKLGLPDEIYMRCIRPFRNSLQFRIKFHN